RKPKSMISTAPEEYRAKYMLAIPSKTRKRIRRNRKKHRDKVEQFLNSLDIDTSAPKEQNGNSSNGTNSTNGTTTTTTSTTNNANNTNNTNNANNTSNTNGANDRADFSDEAYNHISCFYEELQAGNHGALRHCTVKIVDFGNACYINHHYTEEIQTREYR
uniref:Protein kinase domain-containing protein n=1 Tax=Panagrolaimus sp. PS1159 TaxID=55785 RepID=A0AC35GP53_9BILA